MSLMPNRGTAATAAHLPARRRPRMYRPRASAHGAAYWQRASVSGFRDSVFRRRDGRHPISRSHSWRTGHHGNHGKQMCRGFDTTGDDDLQPRAFFVVTRINARGRIAVAWALE